MLCCPTRRPEHTVSVLLRRHSNCKVFSGGIMWSRIWLMCRKKITGDFLGGIMWSRTWHLGKLQVGLSRARRVAQGQTIKIQLFAGLPVQIDGEPWFQHPCTLIISHHGQAGLHVEEGG